MCVGLCDQIDCPILNQSGMERLTGLPHIQRGIGANCDSARVKSNSFPLPQVKLQQSQKGYLDMRHLIILYRYKQPGASLVRLGLG